MLPQLIHLLGVATAVAAVPGMTLHFPTNQTTERASYFTTAKIGTPGQKVELEVVTSNGQNDTFIVTGASYSPGSSSSVTNLTSPSDKHIFEDVVVFDGSDETGTKMGFTQWPSAKTSSIGWDAVRWLDTGNGTLPHNEIGLELRPVPLPLAAEASVSPSRITVGPDEAAYNGTLTYVPSTNGTLPLDRLLVNGKPVLTNGQVILQPHNLGSHASPAVLAAVYAEINGSAPGPSLAAFGRPANYSLPCSTDVVITYVIGGYIVSMTDILARHPDTRSRDPKLPAGTCTGSLDGFVAMANDSNIVYLGAEFFWNTYATIRADPPAVGFAPYKERLAVEPSVLPAATGSGSGAGRVAVGIAAVAAGVVAGVVAGL